MIPEEVEDFTERYRLKKLGLKGDIENAMG